MLAPWHRLERIIKWTGLSVNSFALNIGLKRSENLYQIKKGNNGISRDLAEIITTKYPAISKGWLLSGEGDMFVEVSTSAVLRSGVPYYGMDAVEALSADVLPEPQYYINLPPFIDCDIATLTLSNAMAPDISAASMVILKRWPINAIIPGESYFILSPQFKGIRTIRRIEDSASEYQLLARNSEEFDSIRIDKSTITKLYLVRGIIVKRTL